MRGLSQRLAHFVKGRDDCVIASTERSTTAMIDRHQGTEVSAKKILFRVLTGHQKAT